MARVIGIDLGTTNCCVAVMDGPRPTVLHNKAGYKTTPSVIAIAEDGKRLIGQMAVRQQVTNPEHTVYAAKRLIGRTWDSPQVQHALKVCPYRLIPGPHNDVRIELRGKDYSVPEISALLLQEMRSLAEEQLGESVDQAIVTVPAYFNDNQRQGVRDAGRIAGLDVLRILNEPTAAAIAYGLTRDQAKTIVVYDLGGGTFDVSVVRVDPKAGYDVIATTGDSYLGGEDFDNRIVEWMLQKLQDSAGVDASNSPLALARMRQAAQKAKCDLSDMAVTEVQLPFLMTGPRGAIHLETQLRRDELERMTGDLVTRSLAICEKALKLAEMRIRDVEEVVLVGGMTRMPAVQRAVSEFFEREPSKGVHPDEVVAVGAAVYGQMLQQNDGVSASVPLHDVTAHSLGIMTAGGGFDALIPANTTVPVRIANVFSTSRDHQEQVKVVVLQGESERAKENDFLSQFALTGLRKAKAGEVEVEVVFEIDNDGIFRVAAIDRETGIAQTIDVLAQSGLEEDEIQRMMQDAQQHMADRRVHEQQEKHRQGIDVLLADLDKLLPQAEQKVSGTPVAAAAIIKARKAVDQVRAQVTAGNREKLGENLATLEKLSGMLKQVLSR